MMTIDAETNVTRENGFWSYCVNGRMPGDLGEWEARGLVERGRLGLRINGNELGRLREFREFSLRGVDLATPTSSGPREGGLPLIFASLEKFSARAVVFLDIGGLYGFGWEDFAESVGLVKGAGHELAMHVHPSASVYGREWFREHGIPQPPAGVYSEWWPKEVIGPFHEVITADMAAVAGVSPQAYRAGAYRISDTIIDSLVQLGYRFDCSYDLLNRKGHVNIEGQGQLGNMVSRYRGLVEIPISAFVTRRDRKLRRMVVGRGKSRVRQLALEEFHRAGVRVVSYILHSYSLMERVEDPDDPSRTLGWGGPDERVIANFEEDLAFIAGSSEFEIVDTRGLDEVIREEPGILVGSGAIPEV